VNVSLAPNTPVGPISAMQALETATRHRDAENFESAKFICRQLLGHEYVSVDASIIMLEIAIEQRRPAETHEFCERLQKSAPRHLHALATLATALRNLNKHDQALKVIRKALKAHPSSCELRNLLAGYLIEINEKDLANKELRTINRIDQFFMPAYLHLAALGTLTEEELAWLESTEFADADRVTVYTALATAFRRSQDVDREFHYLNLAQSTLAARATREPPDLTADIRKSIEIFDRSFFSTRGPNEATSHTPIFIMGMPRSGSTLTEQLLQADEGVDGIGETSILHCIVHDLCRKRFGGRPFLEAVNEFNDADIAEITTKYLSQVATIYTRAPVSVNKQLRNYMYIGILHLAFPNARFIHTIRDPLDNCLSCYQQVFDKMDESRTLESLAQSYLDHLVMMDHWKQLLGDRIFTARYEDMIENPREQSQALLKFCGIPWKEDVLKFHERKTAVKTASVMQVRKPIYSTSVDKWRRYEKHLGPIIPILDPVR